MYGTNALITWYLMVGLRHTFFKEIGSSENLTKEWPIL